VKTATATTEPTVHKIRNALLKVVGVPPSEDKADVYNAMLEVTGLVSDGTDKDAETALITLRDTIGIRTPLECVAEFHLTFDLSAPKGQTLPGLPERKLRKRLSDEENNELRDAETVEDYLDAVVDKLYYAYGDAVCAGLEDWQIAGALAHVHRANMAKLWTDDQVREAIKPGWTSKPIGDGRNVVRDEHGKVKKPPGWTPPDLAPFVIQHRNTATA
jgi:hypothetical protein